MTHSPNKRILSDPASLIFQTMQETFYWVASTLNRFQLELQALPELTHALSSQKTFPMNIIERLEQIKSEIKAFENDLRRSKRDWEVERQYTYFRSTDLPQSEQAALQAINQHFVTVTDQIQGEASAIAKKLDARLVDRTDLLWDYEMEATCHFVLREDDPGYSEDSDNLLTSRALFIHPAKDDAGRWKFGGQDWPEGYVNDPMPHGMLFHELHHYESHHGESPSQNLKDIQRVGDVWMNLIVCYQFYYDLVQGKWVKSFNTNAGNDGDREYVSSAVHDAI